MDRGIVLQDYLLGGFLPAEPGLSYVFFGDGVVAMAHYQNPFLKMT